MEHIQRKFPNRFQQIRSLAQRNREFEDICNDYEEISTWLSNQGRTGKSTKKELDRARELIKDLEEDIIKVLTKEFIE